MTTHHKLKCCMEPLNQSVRGLSNGDRLQMEFEFVQNLANPAYLHFLAQNRYFQDEKFMNFLKYLEYWKRPEYLKHLVFPQCLAFLDALNNVPDFKQVTHFSCKTNSFLIHYPSYAMYARMYVCRNYRISPFEILYIVNRVYYGQMAPGRNQWNLVIALTHKMST